MTKTVREGPLEGFHNNEGNFIKTKREGMDFIGKFLATIDPRFLQEMEDFFFFYHLKTIDRYR